MRYSPLLLPGLLLAGLTSYAQTTAPLPAADQVSADVLTDKLQVRVGLNAARIFRHGSYYGLFSRVPLSAGLEYAASRRFTLYGQVDADLGLFRHDPFRRVDQPLVPTGALSVGGRYYYNQEGRARHNRAQGAFVGNYLAAEFHTEMLRTPEFVVTTPVPNLEGYYRYRTTYVPTLNLLWGMQRRLSRSFLFDLNAGVGLSPTRSDAHFGGYSVGGLNISTQVNLGVYFGR
jgi:hypothetical protein